MSDNTTTEIVERETSEEAEKDMNEYLVQQGLTEEEIANLRMTEAEQDRAADQEAADQEAADQESKQSEDGDADAQEEIQIPEIPEAPVMTEIDEAAEAAAKTRLAAIDEERKSLQDKLEEGELDAEEYAKSSDQLTQEFIQLKVEEGKFNEARESNKKIEDFLWQQHHKAFFSRPEHAPLEVIGPLHFRLKENMKELYEGEYKTAGIDKTYEILEKAKQMLLKDKGVIEECKSKGVDLSIFPLFQDKAAPPKDQSQPAPITLANKPTGKGSTEEGGKWAAVDAVINKGEFDGDDFENVLGRMSEEERDRYLDETA